MSTLYIVSTPIGNLEDLSFRALRILRGVDLILCEDTRVTRKLLNRYKIATPTLSYHQHSKLKKINYILDLLKQPARNASRSDAGGGKDLALVSDAGTPGISDPGNKLIQAIINTLNTSYQGDRRLSAYPDIKIVPVPGPSAVTAAASISGFPMDKFLFLGFPPAKRKRKKFFEQVVHSKYPVIFYESPHRILKTLNELAVILSEAKRSEESWQIVVCRELTKKFETIYRGTIEQVIKRIEKPARNTSQASACSRSDAGGDKIKGEFVVIVNTQL